MTDFIEKLFFHFFIMMIIPLVHILFTRTMKKRVFHSFFLGIIIVTLFLTMYFPVNIGDVKFDLKFIPIFVAFAYFGPLIGALAILSLVLLKGFLVHGNVLITLLNYVIISVPLFFIQKRYQLLSISKKCLAALLFYSIITITRMIALANTDQSQYSFYLLTFSFVSFLTLAIIIYTIEVNQLQMFMLQKLQTAEKLNAISQLAASVAHEIRNPMTTIRGFMQLLKNEENLTRDQNMFVRLSLDELDRTQHIIDDFLSLARPTTNEYSRINASTLLTEIIDFMRPFSTISNTEIVSDIEEGIFINGDANEFKQLAINLMKNGIEAMPEGGTLEVAAAIQGGKAVISVKDSGMGLSQQQITRLGQPYYSTKTSGTGLGLMISFDIIRRMSGKVEVKSKEKKGAVFILTFPIGAESNR